MRHSFSLENCPNTNRMLYKFLFLFLCLPCFVVPSCFFLCVFLFPFSFFACELQWLRHLIISTFGLSDRGDFLVLKFSVVLDLCAYLLMIWARISNCDFCDSPSSLTLDLLLPIEVFLCFRLLIAFHACCCESNWEFAMTKHSNKLTFRFL